MSSKFRRVYLRHSDFIRRIKKQSMSVLLFYYIHIQNRKLSISQSITISAAIVHGLNHINCLSWMKSLSLIIYFHNVDLLLSKHYSSKAILTSRIAILRNVSGKNGSWVCEWVFACGNSILVHRLFHQIDWYMFRRKFKNRYNWIATHRSCVQVLQKKPNEANDH